MEKTWNILDILNWTTDFLEKKQISEAKYKTELLLSHVLELKRFELYLYFDRPLSKKERADFKLLLNRLVDNEPVQYILGKWEFYGYDFIVNENVLIPRRETEELVERIVKYVNALEIEESGEQVEGEAVIGQPRRATHTHPPLYLLDVGTGSGAIIIALYLELKKKLKENFDDIKFMAVDISEDALEIARKNAELNEIGQGEIEFVKSDLLYDVEKNIWQETANLIMVSNPPYVSLSEYNNLEKELSFEPKNAITDNGDGLYFYIKLIKEIMEKKIKKSFFEIGYNQKDQLTKICEENGIENFKFHKDLSGKWRMLEITN